MADNMSWTIEYNSDCKIIVVPCTGVWTPELDMEMLSELKKAAESYQCNSLLVDHRLSKMKFKFMTTFNRPNLYDDLHFSKDTRAPWYGRRLSRITCFSKLSA